MLGAAVNVALNLVLIPSPLGIQGAAVATFASCLAVFVFRAVSARRYIPFQLYPARLTAGCVILGLQTIAILLQIPLWPLVQAVGVLLLFLLGGRPFLTEASKLGLPIPRSQ